MRESRYKIVRFSDSKSRAESIENAAIPKLNTHLETIESTFADWGATIQTMSDEVSSVSSRVESLANGHGSVDSKADLVSDSLKNIVERLNSLEKSIAEGNSKFAVLQNDVSSIAKRVSIVENETAAIIGSTIDELLDEPRSPLRLVGLFQIHAIFR